LTRRHGSELLLERAAALPDADHGATATTRRRLRTICEHSGFEEGVLEALRGPEVVHFCGHRLTPGHRSSRFPGDAEQRVAADIRSELDRCQPAYAYGALASGADILWAEALLERGVELHIVLPFARSEFIKASVAPGGLGWIERFERCLVLVRAERQHAQLSPRSGVHRRTVWSRPTVTTSDPPGLKAEEAMPRVWPIRSTSALPVATFQMVARESHGGRQFAHDPAGGGFLDADRAGRRPVRLSDQQETSVGAEGGDRGAADRAVGERLAARKPQLREGHRARIVRGVQQLERVSGKRSVAFGAGEGQICLLCAERPPDPADAVIGGRKQRPAVG
jgi:hypothetical protein